MGPLQQFVVGLLEHEGALVEAIDPDGLEVVAPSRLQQALRLPELSRLGFGAALPEGGQRVGIEGDWLDRFGGLFGERGRWDRRTLAPDNPTLAGADRLIEREIELANAPVRLTGVAPAWTRYLIFDFRFTALSDEKRDGLLRLGVNLATGAVLDRVLDRLAPWLADETPDAALPKAIELPPSWERGRLLALLDQALRPRIEDRLGPFVASLRRRLARDQERLYSYHDDLHRETQVRLAALPAGAEGRKRELMRIDAIARDYRAKLDDLGHKYALRVSIEWVQTLELLMPVQRLELLVRRRKGERTIRLDWNPLARRLEQLPCEFSHGPERKRLACDEALHLVSSPGLAPCGGCGGPYCRVCHRNRCPKCGRAGPPPTVGLGAREDGGAR